MMKLKRQEEKRGRKEASRLMRKKFLEDRNKDIVAQIAQDTPQ